MLQSPLFLRVMGKNLKGIYAFERVYGWWKTRIKTEEADFIAIQ